MFKQPVYKVAAVHVEKVAEGEASAPTTTASRPALPGRVRPSGGSSDDMAEERIVPTDPPIVATEEEHR